MGSFDVQTNHGHRIAGQVNVPNAHGGWSEVRAIPLDPSGHDAATAPQVRLLMYAPDDRMDTDLAVVVEQQTDLGWDNRTALRVAVRRRADSDGDTVVESEVFYVRAWNAPSDIPLADLDAFLALPDVAAHLRRFCTMAQKLRDIKASAATPLPSAESV